MILSSKFQSDDYIEYGVGYSFVWVKTWVTSYLLIFISLKFKAKGLVFLLLTVIAKHVSKTTNNTKVKIHSVGMGIGLIYVFGLDFQLLYCVCVKTVGQVQPTAHIASPTKATLVTSLCHVQRGRWCSNFLLLGHSS